MDTDPLIPFSDTLSEAPVHAGVAFALRCDGDENHLQFPDFAVVVVTPAQAAEWLRLREGMIALGADSLSVVNRWMPALFQRDIDYEADVETVGPGIEILEAALVVGRAGVRWETLIASDTERFRTEVIPWTRLQEIAAAIVTPTPEPDALREFAQAADAFLRVCFDCIPDRRNPARSRWDQSCDALEDALDRHVWSKDRATPSRR